MAELDTWQAVDTVVNSLEAQKQIYTTFSIWLVSACSDRFRSVMSTMKFFTRIPCCVLM